MTDRNSVDGFISRRPTSRLGGHDGSARVIKQQEPGPRAVSGYRDAQKVDESARLVKSNTEGLGLTRSDIDESLAQIDTDIVDEEPKRGKRGPRRPRKPGSSWKKIIVRSLIVLLLIGLVFGGYFVWRVMRSGGQVFTGDIFGLLQQKDLSMDSSGRTNVLLFGTSEDDPGHEGAYLTDSIMVLSVNQKTKDAYTFSIPRDLRVKYGPSCTSAGTYGKINAYYNCVNDNYTSQDAEKERQTKMREFVGNIVGMNIQYSVHVNYSVVRDIVNAIGSITITIEGSGGDPGIMDSNFDWKCGVAVPSLTRTAAQKAKCPPNGHFIDYPNGQVTLDAEHTLYVAQARGDCVPIAGGCMPTYGLSRSNYDRELNQQKIIKAIKEKAVSAGTLTDLNKVNNLISAIGDNLRTNFDSSEVRTVVSLAKDIPSDQIKSISLVDANPELFTGDNENNVIPVAGIYDYSGIQAYIRKQISADPIVKEGARLVVLNGSGVVGVAKSEGEKLTPLGMAIDQVANAPVGTYPASIIYNVTNNKPKTADKLAQIYGVTPVMTPPPITVAAGVDFVIIVAAPSVLPSPIAAP